MENCKPKDVLVVKGDKLSKDQCPKNDIERNFIDNVPYASVKTKEHILVYKKIDNLDVIGYSSSDFASYPDDENLLLDKRRSTKNI
ncbi:hypothetical protein CR513_07116, partial [Mucuna pruriens]